MTALNDQVAQFHQGIGCVVKNVKHTVDAVGVDNRRIDQIAFNNYLSIMFGVDIQVSGCISIFVNPSQA